MSLIAWQLAGIAALVLLSALFSSAEVAFTGLTLAQINRIKRIRPNALDIWERRPDRLLAALFLLNNAVNAGVGVLAAGIGIDASNMLGVRPSVAALALGILSGVAVLLFGELIPKVWARRYTVSWALRLSPLMRVLTTVVSPVAQAAVTVTNVILLRFRRRYTGFPFLQENELKKILTHSTIPSGPRKILDNLIDFSQSHVSDLMIPRPRIFALSTAERMDKIIEKVIASGFSRIPIYTRTLDNIRGVLYSKDLLVAWRSGVVVLEDLLRPVYAVQPNMPLPALLRTFRRGRQHLAIVRWPNSNRIEGVVTLQDALETIVGEIKEES